MHTTYEEEGINLEIVYVCAVARGSWSTQAVAVRVVRSRCGWHFSANSDITSLFGELLFDV